MPDLKMPEVNECRIAGRLTRDAEVRAFAGNAKVCDFSVAVDGSYKDKSGEWKKTTDFVSCVMYNPSDKTVDSLRKGAPVLVSGEIRVEQWEKDGRQNSKTRVRAVRVQLLAWPAKDEAPPARAQQPDATPVDDDIPF